MFPLEQHAHTWQSNVFFVYHQDMNSEEIIFFPHTYVYVYIAISKRISVYINTYEHTHMHTETQTYTHLMYL